MPQLIVSLQAGMKVDTQNKDYRKPKNNRDKMQQVPYLNRWGPLKEKTNARAKSASTHCFLPLLELERWKNNCRN